MDRLEQIALEHGLCTCDEAYTKRGLTAPDCPWHAFAVQEAMEQYATEVARHNLERAAELVDAGCELAVMNTEIELI